MFLSGDPVFSLVFCCYCDPTCFCSIFSSFHRGYWGGGGGGRKMPFLFIQIKFAILKMIFARQRLKMGSEKDPKGLFLSANCFQKFFVCIIYFKFAYLKVKLIVPLVFIQHSNRKIIFLQGTTRPFQPFCSNYLQESQRLNRS